ncbi:MAG TPA: PRC-barrel domain-containing protein [Candidatus Binatia bacterium]|nr:PRC-barrel domain-containing protein [Candidatus Binatia bacterium]
MNSLTRGLLAAGVLSTAALATIPAGAQSTTVAPATTPPPATTTDTSSSTSNSMGIGTAVRNADGSYNASAVIGLDVRNSNNDSIGSVRQLIVDKSGKVSGVVVDVGGFLGIGAHPVLLQWNQVQLADRDGKTIAVVDVDKDTLKQMPAYKS